jgi:hypothetical protein
MVLVSTLRPARVAWDRLQARAGRRLYAKDAPRTGDCLLLPGEIAPPSLEHFAFKNHQI